LEQQLHLGVQANQQARPGPQGPRQGEAPVTVYVDNMRAKFGRMVMCHMLADSREELDAMADKIGVARRWIQYPGTYKEHYDIALSARAKAVAEGAVEIDVRDTGKMIGDRRRALRVRT
jgi:hypothetical protein